MTLVRLLAADVAAVHLVVKHRLKLALSSRGCCLGRLHAAAAHDELVVRGFVAAVGGDGGGVKRAVALDGGENVECVPAETQSMREEAERQQRGGGGGGMAYASYNLAVWSVDVTMKRVRS